MLFARDAHDLDRPALNEAEQHRARDAHMTTSAHKLDPPFSDQATNKAGAGVQQHFASSTVNNNPSIIDIPSIGSRVSASPTFDGVVSVLSVKGAFGVTA